MMKFIISMGVAAVVWAVGMTRASADASLMETGPAGTLTLTVQIDGQHTVTASASYPFKIRGEVQVQAPLVMKGGTDALKAMFGSLEDTSNGSPRMSDVKGQLKVSGGRISGHVRCEWDVQGNTMFFEADLQGQYTRTSLTITCREGKAGGSWNWGGGVAELTGKINSFKIELKSQGSPKQK